MTSTSAPQYLYTSTHLLKWIFLIGFIFLLPTRTFAQDYDKLRLGIGGGNMTSNHVPGLLVYLEPSYRLTDRFALAFRFENTAGGGLMNGDNDGTINAMASYSFNGQYYLLSKGSVRPFVGLGAGVFTPNNGIFGCDCKGQPKAHALGFYPRVGFDYHHMTMSLDYNAVQSVKQVNIYSDPPRPASGPTTYYYARTSYLALRFGFFIGGGKKNISATD